jgi:LysM repeat protein
MTMPANTLPIQQIIQNATQAMQRGDKRTARYWAQIAVSMAPQLEDPWLILAAVSGPRAAIEYLKQALLVNPGSERAMRGLHWAQARLAKQKPRPAASSNSATQPLVSATQPITARLPVVQPVREAAARPAPGKPKGPASGWSSLATKRLSIPVLLLTLMCVVGALVAWPGSTSSALGLINSNAGNDPQGLAWSYAQILKPTYTPAATATLPATATPLPTLTPTATPEPTALPTDLPTSVSPTDVPPPVNIQVIGNYSVRAGDSLSSIAQRAAVTTAELAAANQISVYATIYPGQVLGIPLGGVIPDPAAQPDPGPLPVQDPPVQYGAKYILVDISEQHLYAYEGDMLVYSFVASTGMNNATRVGVFSVLDKIPNAYGANWNIWMPNWMGIYYAGSLENGIHALPILPGGGRLWAGYLGSPISYGCVVLGIDEAQWLYDWAEVGTTVEIRR